MKVVAPSGLPKAALTYYKTLTRALKHHIAIKNVGLETQRDGSAHAALPSSLEPVFSGEKCPTLIP